MSNAQIAPMTKLALDKFYTKPEVVESCVDDLLDRLPVFEDLVIEPSAGNGVWLPHFSDCDILAYDLAPERDNITQQDFLKLDLDQFDQYLHFVGNPPFGSNSSLAKKFIKKMAACPNTQTIALILPASFSKLQNQKAFPLCFHLLFEKDTPKNAFTDESTGKSKNVNCVFQIWERRDYNRYVPVNLKPQGFAFVKPDEADFSICHKGSNPGVLRLPTYVNGTGLAVSRSCSYYHFKLDKFDPDFEMIYNMISRNNYNSRNMGAPGITKQDIIREIERSILVSRYC